MAPKMSFLKKDASKSMKETDAKPDKAPKEKTPKAPKDSNASQKNFLGKEKKKPRAEYEEEIAKLKQDLTSKDGELKQNEEEINKLKQELAYKDGELSALKQWASSAPVR